MKIGIDIRTLMDAQYSGVPYYTLNLIKEIFKQDTINEYRLFYNSFGDCPQMPEFNGKNVKVVKYNYPNKIINYLFFKIFNYPKIDKELEADIFFMPHINFIGLSAKVKNLLTVYDLSFLKNPEFFSLRQNFWHKMIGVKRLLKRFDKIIAISENTKRDIVELCGVSPEKIKVIYPGLGEEYRQIPNSQFPISLATPDLAKPDNFQFSNLNADERRLAEVRSKYNLPDKFILYLGTVEPRKNIEGIIGAYNELRNNNPDLNNVKLIIAGGKGWKSRKIYEKREASEFRDDIKFLGYVDSADKVYLYNLAAVFIYPSFYEGFGLPPLEAMASGTPVITGNISSLPEVAGEAALMVDPYNISEIAGAMEVILVDNSLKNKLVARGLEHVKKFSWGKTAEEYLKIINHG